MDRDLQRTSRGQVEDKHEMANETERCRADRKYNFTKIGMQQELDIGQQEKLTTVPDVIISSFNQLFGVTRSYDNLGLPPVDMVW